MGVNGENFLSTLQSLREQPASIHDIKIRINFSIHQKLQELGHKINPHNNGIFMEIPDFDKNIHTKASVYPQTIQLDLGCSSNPIVYDVVSIIELASYLGSVRLYFAWITGSMFPQITDWVITHYHFGKDGKESRSGQTCHFTFEEIAGGTIRYYAKVLKSGKIMDRIEQIQTPHAKLEEELNKILFASSYFE